ncbi:MAG TPA: hypothetical protein VFD73_27490, partial [Gemmatimonadales bacterium]|nr:hypothetical protein [Gemmatimonadales bacterium]
RALDEAVDIHVGSLLQSTLVPERNDSSRFNVPMTAARREEHLGHTNGMSTSRPTGTPPCQWPCQC